MSMMQPYDWRGYIEITGVNLRKFINDVYKMSSVVGMGFLQKYTNKAEESQGLTEEVIDIFMAGGQTDYIFGKADSPSDPGFLQKNQAIIVDMDYVHGAQCKMRVYMEPQTKRIFIDRIWGDHSRYQLIALLEKNGFKDGASMIERAENAYEEKKADDVKQANLDREYILLKIIREGAIVEDKCVLVMGMGENGVFFETREYQGINSLSQTEKGEYIPYSQQESDDDFDWSKKIATVTIWGSLLVKATELLQKAEAA